VALVRMFAFPPTVKIVLVALAFSPVPPLLPKRETKAGGDTSFGLGLMAILALVSIVTVPATVEVLARFLGRQLVSAPGAIAAMLFKGALVPLALGMAVRALAPAIAERLDKPVTLVARVLLPLAVLVLVSGALSAIWALVGNGTVLAMVIFTVAGLAIGHVLGGPNPDHSVVLALSTACRHPAIALAIATANFPNEKFGPIMLLYLIVNAVVGIPYLAWQRRQIARAVRSV
jgi:bile acid:Na+ symporter, BASS family